MNTKSFFDFGNGVHARIRNVIVLSCGYDQPKTSKEIDIAQEARLISIAALPEQGIFVVIVDWQLNLPERTRIVWCKVAVEFELKDFSHVFDVTDDGHTISPRLAVDKQFFSIAYQTVRGVVAAKLAGTPWSRRLPSLVRTEDIVPTSVVKVPVKKKVAQRATKRKSS